ncbi:MAG: radical SAM/SPASM domain-containing protein [Acidobacteriota bacterium]
MIGKGHYALIEPGDRLLTRLWKRISSRRVPRFPRTVQIQTRTGCNADCIWCPYGATFSTQPRGVMDWGLFERIIEECARHRVRRLSPYLMNEPFLDRDLPRRIRFMHQKCPGAKIVVTTNGSRLFPDVIKEIVDLGPALHALYISFQGIEKEGYERTMRGTMNFDQTFENVNHLLEALEARGAVSPKVWITMVDTNLVDAKKAVAYWRKRGVASKYTTLENRGGNIAQAEGLAHTRMDYYTTCTRLMKQGYILFNGDMVICCTDYSRQMTLGNIASSSISQVWNGERAMAYRRAYLGGRFDELPLCRVCKVDRVREVEVLPWKGVEGGVTN